MTFNFSLPASTGAIKNIHLTLKDESLGRVFHFRTPLRILKDQWDYEKQRPINIYEKKYKRLNKKINKIKLHLSELITQKSGEQKICCQRTLSREIQKICTTHDIKAPENTILYYMQKYIVAKKEIICHSTYKRYMVFYNLIERFEGHTSKRLYLDTLNSDFINDFISFGKQEEYSSNTIYRTIHFVKTILNFAERKGIRTCVRELDIRREKQQTKMITLTEDEIIQLQQTEVSKELQPAKDWLLISCYTGQRFSDFMRFESKKMDFINGKVCISFIQKKTKKEIKLPLHPTILHIIRRNRNGFPKQMNLHLYNNQIKEIAKLSGLKDLVKARKRIGYRSKEVEAEKWKVLSSHIGRRSFATNFYGKIPTPLLMEATGHSTEQMFLKYINPADHERMLSLGNYFNQMYKERYRAS